MAGLVMHRARAGYTNLAAAANLPATMEAAHPINTPRAPGVYAVVIARLRDHR